MNEKERGSLQIQKNRVSKRSQLAVCIQEDLSTSEIRKDLQTRVMKKKVFLVGRDGLDKIYLKFFYVLAY